MEASFPLLFAAAVGFGHAFEADHLVAVGNIVTKRDRLAFAIKDGIYWGLGHTSTIFLIGMIMIVGKSTFLNGYFGYFEAIVGLMLIILGTRASSSLGLRSGPPPSNTSCLCCRPSTLGAERPRLSS